MKDFDEHQALLTYLYCSGKKKGLLSGLILLDIHKQKYPTQRSAQYRYEMAGGFAWDIFNRLESIDFVEVVGTTNLDVCNESRRHKKVAVYDTTDFFEFMMEQELGCYLEKGELQEYYEKFQEETRASINSLENLLE